MWGQKRRKGDNDVVGYGAEGLAKLKFRGVKALREDF